MPSDAGQAAPPRRAVACHRRARQAIPGDVPHRGAIGRPRPVVADHEGVLDLLPLLRDRGTGVLGDGQVRLVRQPDLGGGRAPGVEVGHGLRVVRHVRGIGDLQAGRRVIVDPHLEPDPGRARGRDHAAVGKTNAPIIGAVIGAQSEHQRVRGAVELGDVTIAGIGHAPCGAAGTVFQHFQAARNVGGPRRDRVGQHDVGRAVPAAVGETEGVGQDVPGDHLAAVVVHHVLGERTHQVRHVHVDGQAGHAGVDHFAGATPDPQDRRGRTIGQRRAGLQEVQVQAQGIGVIRRAPRGDMVPVHADGAVPEVPDRVDGVGDVAQARSGGPELQARASIAGPSV